MKPSVHDSLSCSCRILPVTGHHILALDYDFTLLTISKSLAVTVTNLDFHRFHDST